MWHCQWKSKHSFHIQEINQKLRDNLKRMMGTTWLHGTGRQRGKGIPGNRGRGWWQREKDKGREGKNKKRREEGAHFLARARAVIRHTTAWQQLILSYPLLFSDPSMLMLNPSPSSISGASPRENRLTRAQYALLLSSSFNSHDLLACYSCCLYLISLCRSIQNLVKSFNQPQPNPQQQQQQMHDVVCSYLSLLHLLHPYNNIPAPHQLIHHNVHYITHKQYIKHH